MQNLCVDKVPSPDPDQNQLPSGPAQVQYSEKMKTIFLKVMPNSFSCLHFQPLLLTKVCLKLLVASDALLDFHNRIWKDHEHLIGKPGGVLITLRRCQEALAKQ